MLFLLAALAVGWGLLASTVIPWLLDVLLLAGLVLNSAIIAQFSTMDDVAPKEAIMESFGWLNATASAGSAVGASVVDLLITVRSEPGFLLAGEMCAAGFIVAGALQSRWRSSETVSVAGTGHTTETK